jgi:hypothetical protein
MFSPTGFVCVVSGLMPCSNVVKHFDPHHVLTWCYPEKKLKIL